MPPQIPLSATMRLQLHKGFTFADAARVVPYMARLGVEPSVCLPHPDRTAGLDARV